MHCPHRGTLCTALDISNVTQAITGGDRKIHLRQVFLLPPSEENLTKCLFESRDAMLLAFRHKPIFSD